MSTPTVEDAIEFANDLRQTVREQGHAVAYAKAYEADPNLLALVTVLHAAA
jgi:hypothetical protein